MSELVCHRIAEPLSYAAAYALQLRRHAELVAPGARVAHLLLLEHTPVYTLGRATRAEHLLLPRAELARRAGAEVIEADRGGSVTFHGPGQLVAYLLLNLKSWDMAIHGHLWNLEETAIQTLAAFGLRGQRAPAMTGVWVDPARSPAAPPGTPRNVESGRVERGALLGRGATLHSLTLSPSHPLTLSPSHFPTLRLPPPRGPERGADQLAKVCAIGVGCRRWVTYHGLALNVDMDLTPFSHIDPCGLGRRPVTSLARCLGRKVTMAEVEAALRTALGHVFGTGVCRGD